MPTIRANSGINPLGPLVGALLVSAAGGWKTPYPLSAQHRPHPCPWSTYAAAILLPIVLASASVAIAVALGTEFPVDAALSRWTESADAFVIMLFFVGLGEEPGWRGWLLPNLQMWMAPWQAALAIAPVWALWHLPLLGQEVPPDQFVPFLISLTSASIVLAWLTNRTEGGALPAMLCHATVNAVGAAYLFSFFSGPEKTMLRWINAILWGIAAFAIAWRRSGRLGLKAAGGQVPAISKSAPSLAPDGSVAAGTT